MQERKTSKQLVMSYVNSKEQQQKNSKGFVYELSREAGRSVLLRAWSEDDSLTLEGVSASTTSIVESRSSSLRKHEQVKFRARQRLGCPRGTFWHFSASKFP